MSQASEFALIAASLSTLEKQVRTAAFRAIYRGIRPTPAQLAGDLGLSIEEVNAAIGSLVQLGLMTLDEAGRVTGSHGISLIPSVHRIVFNVGERFVWCAVDAVGIPAAMGLDAEIESRCFACGHPLTLSIMAGRPYGEASMFLRIGIAVGSRTGKVIENVCPMLNFFCSDRHARQWSNGVVGSAVLTIEQAAEMSRRAWVDVSPA